MPFRNALLVVLGLCIHACAVMAQEEKLTIDPAKSEVHFTLDDPLHAVHGTFRVSTGAIVFDPKDGRMSGSVAVDAASGESGNTSRDKKMTADQLKAKQYHTVNFEPKHYSGALAPSGDSTITADGTFTLLGTPHAISVPMQVHLEGSQCKATGTFSVPYVEWGMKDPSNFLLKVSKTVTVNLVLVGSVAGGHPN